MILKKDPTPAAVDQFAQLAQQAHDFIDRVRDDFASGNDGGKLGDAETEVFAAANALKNAVGAVVAYTGSLNPATLAKFTCQYQTAVARVERRDPERLADREESRPELTEPRHPHHGRPDPTPLPRIDASALRRLRTPFLPTR